MIRFANPGSDIDGFTRIFHAVVEALEGRQPFSLDDISSALISKGLATSSGFMGQAALDRSTREDRSLDPLYNQSKMYSELFRLLGWIHPTPQSQLSFRFTWLGLHVREAGADAKKLVVECMLGIAFPNEVVKSKGGYILRPFATILRSMILLDGLMSRDEMIYGPLSLLEDTSREEFAEMVGRVRAIRGKADRLEEHLDKHALEQGVQRNTMMNYTRFPLAVLEWSGWTQKWNNSSIYKSPVVFHRLTENGREQVRWINASTDLRAKTVIGKPTTVRDAISKLAVIQMLDRAGFDTQSFRGGLNEWTGILIGERVIADPSVSILFSPFQEMPPALVSGLFESHAKALKGVGDVPDHGRRSGSNPSGRGKIPVMSVRLESGRPSSRTIESGGLKVVSLLKTIASKRGDDAAIVAQEVMALFQNASMGKFYPLVAGLFACLGFDSTSSPVGVNYARWDAIIRHTSDSVPIEIKSPAEVRCISVKAVRQALENKIILMARRPFPTREASTSLVVAFLPPNERAEVGNLVMDIHTAFSINIGLVDLLSLLRLAIGVVVEGKSPDREAILSLRGFIDVVNS